MCAMIVRVSPKVYTTATVSQYKQQISPPAAPVLLAGYPVTYNIGSVESNMKGETTLNFHARKKAGELLPYTGWEKFTAECTSSGSQTFDYQNFRWYYTPSVPLGETYPTIGREFLRGKVPGYDLNSLVVAAAAKIQGSGFDALTFLAELTKTVSMFKNLGGKLLSLIKGKPPGTPWDLWLEGRYGWRTFLYDMIDLSEAINELGAGKKTRLKDKVGTSYSWQDNYLSQTGTNFAYDWKCYYRDSYKCNVRASVIADIGVDSFQFDVIQTAWELIPFSFVVDWFINVGNILLSAQFLAGVKAYQACWGYKINLEREVWIEYIPKAGVTNSVSVASGKGTASLEVRTPTTVRLNPAIQFNLDEFKIADLVALVIKAVFK